MCERGRWNYVSQRRQQRFIRDTAAMRIEEVKSTTRAARRDALAREGLGLNDDGSAAEVAAGLVGQEKARVSRRRGGAD